MFNYIIYILCTLSSVNFAKRHVIFNSSLRIVKLIGVIYLSILGINIRKLRDSRSLTQFHLGEKIGVAESTISLYESGKREPDIATLNNIANFFGVSIDYLLGRENISTASVTPAPQTTELSQEDLALLEVARQLKNLPDTDRKEIESYIQYKKSLNKKD